MNATYPAAWPTYSLFEFGDYSFNMIVPGLLLLNGHGPADPLIAC